MNRRLLGLRMLLVLALALGGQVMAACAGAQPDVDTGTCPPGGVYQNLEGDCPSSWSGAPCPPGPAEFICGPCGIVYDCSIQWSSNDLRWWRSSYSCNCVTDEGHLIQSSDCFHVKM